MKKILLFLLVLSSFTAFAQTTIFINEIHYDNSGGDTGEGVEIAGPSGTNLSGWKLIPYNGSNGQSYSSTNLSGVIPNQNNGFGTIWFGITGLQNGSPDGVALIDASNNVIQFLSYEGSFTASNGDASGVTSTDLGVSESSSSTVGHSLQLNGTGNTYEDFSWIGSSANTAGNINTNQTFTASGGPTIPTVLLEIADTKTLIAKFSEPMGASAIDVNNYIGFPAISSLVFNANQDQVTINLSGEINIGITSNYIIDEAVTDAEGDPLAEDYRQLILYNPITSGLILTEIYYNQPGGDDYEYLEIYNNTNNNLPLGGLSFTSGITSDLPEMELAAGAFLILCIDKKNMFTLGNPPNVIQWNGGSLSNGGETLELQNTEGEIVFSVSYDDGGDWPGAADGQGPSLEIIDINGSQNDANNWFASQTLFGNVNGNDFYCTPGFLGNYTPPFSINGGYILNENTFALRFNRDIDPNEISANNFNASFGGSYSSFRTFGDSAVFYWNTLFPAGQVNEIEISNLKGLDATEQLTDFTLEIIVNYSNPNLILSEIMYNPPEDGTDVHEFIEIYNAGATEAKLGGLYFTDGIEFEMPFISLLPGEFILVGEDKSELEHAFPGNTFYEWDGALGNSGETITLVNTALENIFSVSYDDGGSWPSDADGQGSSLELIDPSKNSYAALKWQACPNYANTKGGVIYYATPGELPHAPTPIVFFQRDSAFSYENNKIEIPVLFKTNTEPLQFTVAVNSTNSTADANDFEILSSQSFFIPAGTKNQMISIQLKKDQIRETTEFLALEIVATKNARISRKNTRIYIGDANQGSPDLCINEILTQNSAFHDAFGNTLPWIEIHNPSEVGINLNGFRVRIEKDGQTTTKTINGTVNLLANSFAVLWFDAESTNENNYLNMELPGADAKITLIDAFGTILDAYSYGAQTENISDGRITDCGATFKKHEKPTPGLSNTPTSITESSSVQAISFWPNPVKTVVYRNKENAKQTWILYSSLGKEIAIWNNGLTTLDLSTIQPGIYLVKTDKNEFIGKISR